MTQFRLVRPIRMTGLSASFALSGDFVVDGPVIANAFTLSGPTTGTNGVASTFTVTPNGTMGSTVVVTPAATNAGSVSPTTLTFTSGTSAAQTFTVTRPSSGSSSVSITNNGGLTISGSPITYTSSAIVSTLSTSFSLTSTSTGTKEFCIGHAFKQGEVPSGTDVSLSGSSVSAQVTAKNYWSDSSLKFAVIAGTYLSSANVASSISLANTASSTPPTALTTTNLQSAMSGQTCSIDCGAFGSASWAGADWLSPFETWVSGHRMSSFIYRKAVGSDAHLVAWIEVRYYATGAVEILPWIENGYLLVTGPTSKSATYTFTLGSTTRYSGLIDLPHHCRTPLISGTALSHWLGTDPTVTAVHDTDYMQATGLVPAYHAKTPTSASAYTGATASFTPLQLSNFTDGNAMSGGGYHNHIGILPEWDAIYLTAPSASTYKSVIFNGYSMGRYPIHYREDPTFVTVADRYKPARLSNHTTLNLAEPSVGWTTTPATSGTAPPIWAKSHQPSCCFLAYLVTGQRYFLDEVQFAACTNSMIDLSSTNRENGTGLFKSQFAGNERHVAWSLRELAQAIAATPDSDTTYLTEFRTQYQNNLNYYHTRYIGAGGPSAPIFNNGGFVEPSADVGTGGVGTYWVTIWMQDFITASLGYAKDLALGLDATNTTRLNEFFTWKANSIVKRFGFTGTTEYLYRDYGPYYLPIAPTDTPDWTTGAGPWYHNTGNGWGDIYTTTWSGANPPDGSTVPYTSGGTKTEGAIRHWFITNSGPIAALAAMAYAVKHGETGAEAGWQRLTTASNWYSMQTDMDSQPLWALAPKAYPKWWRAITGTVSTPTWTQISGTTIEAITPTHTAYKTNYPAPGSIATGIKGIDAYCGVGMDLTRGIVWTLGNGGHGDYYGNEVMKLDVMVDAPQWKEWFRGSSGPVVNDPPIDNSAYYNDDGISGRLPPSAHTYYCQWPISRHNMVVRIAGVSISPTGSGWVNTEAITTALSQGSNPWQPQFVYRASQLSGITGLYEGNGGFLGQAVCQDPRTEKIYSMANSAYRVFTPATTQPNGSANSGGTWSDMGAGGPTNNWGNNGPAAAVDTRRGRILAVWANSAQYWVYDIDGGTSWINGTSPAGTLTGAGVATLLAQGQGTSHGLTYDPVQDAFLLFMGGAGGQVFKIDASAAVTAFTLVPLTTSGGSAIPFTYMRGGGLTNVESASNYAGVYNRAQYVPRLRGVLYLPKTQANAWFMRTH